MYFDPNLFCPISFSLVKIRLYTENQLPRFSGSALKVCVGGGGGGGWVVCKPNLVFSFGPNQALGLGMGLWPSRTKQAGTELCQAHAQLNCVKFHIAQST